MDTKRAISIIGTGDFGCALAKRLIQNGYQVTIGSRNPLNRNLQKRDEILKAAQVVSVRDCIIASNMIIVAIPYKCTDSLKIHEDFLQGKFLVDVSNPSEISKEKSNAEKLADLLPKSIVIKCFNTVSAYSMGDDTSNEHRQVYVASDDLTALEAVAQMSRDIGFTVHNAGRLHKARDLESEPLYLFRGWGWPTLFTIGLFLMELIALCSMGIIGLTSVPAIGSLMNWREWRFIQSQFGFACFLLTVGHCMVHGVPRWMIQRDLLLRNSFMSLILPWLTLFLKIIYFVPCVHIYVWKIRGGYERGVKYDSEKGDGEFYTNKALDDDSGHSSQSASDNGSEKSTKAIDDIDTFKNLEQLREEHETSFGGSHTHL